MATFMYLSPYTQYYIRKLLRHYISTINYPLSGVGIDAYFQSDLLLVLKRVYSKAVELKAKLQELETLVHLHQTNDLNRIYPYKNLAEIEQNILWLLGLQFLSVLPSLSLSFVSEASAAVFHFVLEKQVQQGMRYADQLYGLVLEFQTEQSLQAAQLLISLTKRQVPFILTASEFRHGIWVNLRSPVYQNLLQREPALLQIA
jgi:hypothetical protein